MRLELWTMKKKSSTRDAFRRLSYPHPSPLPRHPFGSLPSPYPFPSLPKPLPPLFTPSSPTMPLLPAPSPALSPLPPPLPPSPCP